MHLTLGNLGAYDQSAIADVATYFRTDPATLEALLTRHNVSGAYLSWLAEHPRGERIRKTSTADTVGRLLQGMKIPHGNPAVPGYPTFFGLPDDPEWTQMMDNAAAAYQAGFTMYGTSTDTSAKATSVAAAAAAYAAAAAAAASVVGAEAQYYAAVNGEQLGPFSLTTLASMIQTGQFTRDSLIWTEGLSDWMPLEQVTGLAQYLPVTTAAATPAPEPTITYVPTPAPEPTIIYTPAPAAQAQLVQPYYLGIAGKRYGPMTLERLHSALAAGEVSSDSILWTIGMTDWTWITQLAEFADYFQQLPASVAVPAQPAYVPEAASATSATPVYEYPAATEEHEYKRGDDADWEI